MISPYHIRIDWLMWFAAFQSYQHCPWIVHLADKLLDNNNITDQILAVNGNPFKNHTVTLSNMPHRHAGTSGSKKKEPVLETIRFIRAELYEVGTAVLVADLSLLLMMIRTEGLLQYNRAGVVFPNNRVLYHHMHSLVSLC